MAQDEKVKLDLLVDMVKSLSERVQYLSYFIRNDKVIDLKLKDKIKDIENQIE